MSKCKKTVLGIGLVIITVLSWIVSSCTRIVTVTAPFESPLDTSPPVTSQTITTEPSALPSTPTETTPSITPATTDLPPLAGDAPVPAESLTTTPSVYDIDINSYSLAITGSVNNPLSLSYAQIQSYPTVTQNLAIICPDTEDEWDDWTGVPVATLLKEAGLTPEASEVVFTGVDGYYLELPVEFVLQNGIFLAYEMNGQTLPRDRGYPVRLVVSGSVGADWMRWVTKIEVKPALASFSNSSAIIQKLSRNIPIAGSRFCSCLLARFSGPLKPVNQKPL